MATIEELLLLIKTAEDDIDAAQAEVVAKRAAYADALTAKESAEALEIEIVDKAQAQIAAARAAIAELTSPPPVPTYSLTASVVEIAEGMEFSVVLSTTHLSEGVQVPFVVEGVGQEDLTSGMLQGTFLIDTEGKGSQNFTIKKDALTEGDETFTLLIPDVGKSITLPVRDTSKNPTYEFLDPFVIAINEGQSVSFVLKTTDVPEGTLIPYTLSGVQVEDIIGGQLTGSFLIEPDGLGVVNVTVIEDALTEGDETLTLSLVEIPLSSNVLIRDSSVTPPPVPMPTKIEKRFVNMEAVVVCWQTFSTGMQYERYQRNLVVEGPTQKIKWGGWNLGTGNGARRGLLSDSYDLLCDGTPIAKAFRPSVGAQFVEFTVDAAAVQEGWHLFDVSVDPATGESSFPFWGFVKHGPAAKDFEFMPVQRGTYGQILSRTRNVCVWAMLPTKVAPATKPITVKRLRQPPDPKLLRSGLNAEWLVPLRWGDMHRPNIARDGLISTMDLQAYFWDTLHKTPYPVLAAFDGPRGVGTVTMPTHIELGTAVVPTEGNPYFPDGDGYIGNAYITEPTRVLKCRKDGSVTTMAGYRHKANALPHWEQPPTADQLELIGDWSAIPIERRGFFELWGMAWDRRRSGITNTGDPSPYPEERGLIPHAPDRAMRAFVSDSQRDRICMLEFPPDSHFAYERTKVTEHIVDLYDPWDVVAEIVPPLVDGVPQPGSKGILYISERKAHRIVARDMDSGELIRVVLQGNLPVQGTYECVAGSPWIFITPIPAVGTALYLDEPPDGILEYQAYKVERVDLTTQKVTLSTWPGSFPSVVPKASGSGQTLRPLAYVDGNRDVLMQADLVTRQASPCCAPEGLFLQDGWLWFASKAQAQVRRVNLETGELQIVRPIKIDNNSRFAKLAVSDGSFGSRGTSFTWTWSNAHGGGPEIWGMDENGTAFGIQNWFITGSGGTGDWHTYPGYGCSGAVAFGQAVFGNSLEGLFRVTKSQPGDVPETNAVTLGRVEYDSVYFDLVHGMGGFGYYGIPLPWGISANIDAYLEFKGHTKPE